MPPRRPRIADIYDEVNRFLAGCLEITDWRAKTPEDLRMVWRVLKRRLLEIDPDWPRREGLVPKGN